MGFHSVNRRLLHQSVMWSFRLSAYIVDQVLRRVRDGFIFTMHKRHLGTESINPKADCMYPSALWQQNPHSGFNHHYSFQNISPWITESYADNFNLKKPSKLTDSTLKLSPLQIGGTSCHKSNHVITFHNSLTVKFSHEIRQAELRIWGLKYMPLLVKVKVSS